MNLHDSCCRCNNSDITVLYREQGYCSPCALAHLEDDPAIDWMLLRTSDTLRKWALGAGELHRAYSIPLRDVIEVEP